MAPQIKSVIQNLEPLVDYPINMNAGTINANRVSIRILRDPVNQTGRVSIEIECRDYNELDNLFQNIKQEISS